MISIIIPTFKRRDMLFFEIEKILEQTYSDIEIIIINDKIENDPTDEIVKKFPFVKYIKYPEKIGPGQKRQVGFALSTGDYIYTPDDDDYLINKHFFQKAVDIMEKDETVMFVSGSSVIKYEDEVDPNKQFENVPMNVLGKIDGMEYLENMQGKYKKPLSSFPTIFRKKAFIDQKFMDQIEMSDVSLYMLASLNGHVQFIDDYVGIYRVHSRSLTTKKSSSKWINNVLRQKEYIFLLARKRFDNPAQWWARHINLSYRFFANTSKSRIEKGKLLGWIFSHSHGYLRVYKYIFIELIKLINNK